MRERRREVWIGTTEAVEMLGGDRATLDRLIDEGRVKATRIGPMPYVNLRDLYPLTTAHDRNAMFAAERTPSWW